MNDDDGIWQLGIFAFEEHVGIAIDGLGLARRVFFYIKVDFDFVDVCLRAVTVLSNKPLEVAHHNCDVAQFFKWVVLGETFSHAFHAADDAHEYLVVLRVPIPSILLGVDVLIVVLLRVQGLARGCEWGCFFWGKAQKQHCDNVAGAQKTRHCLARLR